MSGKEEGYHIVISGFEYDRVIGPIMSKYPVKKLIVLRGETSEEYPGAMELSEHYTEKMEENPIDMETIDTNIYDFNDVFLKTLKTIKEHDDAPIYLNISSAPKLSLVAMMSAAFLAREKTDLEIFYVSPKKYLLPELLNRFKDLEPEDEASVHELKDSIDKFMEKGTGEGIREYEEIPTFPIQDVSETDQDILTVLKKTDGMDSIKDLKDSLNESRKETIERSTIQYRLEKLEDMGLIETERENRRLKISLTRLGEIYQEGW